MAETFKTVISNSR